MKDIFISFSSQNGDEVERVCGMLEKEGFHCFMASRDIEPGKEYAEQLINKLDESKVLVLILTKEANDSPHVLREIEYAVSHKTPIVVYPLEEVALSKSMEYFLMTHQWLSLDENRDVRLVESLNSLLSESDEERVPESVNTEESEEALDLKSAKEYMEMMKQTRRSFLRAFLIMIVVVVLLFAAMFYKYILPDIKNKSVIDSGTLSEQADGDSKEAALEVKIADRITFGRYNDEDIDWRVIKINGDGTAILLSSEILTIKAFDTAEGGKYNDYNGVDYWSYENHIIDDPELRIMARGNNDWSKSNIRTWLNSDREVVEYEDQAPTRQATCVGENFYGNEPGFLYYFTDAEKDAIVTTYNYTMGNVFSKYGLDSMVDTQDKVFLLSEAELSYLRQAGVSVYAKVTAAAREKDSSNSVSSFAENFNIDNYYWWLRDHAIDAKENEGLIVNTEYEEGKEAITQASSVGASAYGIRPAITVDLSKLSSLKEN